MEKLEETLFEAVRKLADPQERAQFLEAACEGKGELRGTLDELLAAQRAADEFFEEGARSASGRLGSSGAARVGLAGGTIVITASEKTGDHIGRYKLLEQIGEGGCGVVYMAEQEEPVRRRVALKVIKLGMDTKQVVARFEAERQALALMEHPNIAKVLDAGATESGRPFFVMELVRGVKVTDYCDQNNLSTAERLELVIQICRAVQHAHQKGIVHRDIKPSNILVTLHDGVPVPKVIDFGIAKATQARLTERTFFTSMEQFVGTPAYMSPEQAEMSGLDIDTRTDIYSLGVLLYELLIGKTPLDLKEPLAAGIEAVRRTIREKEPVTPSTRLGTMLEGELAATARHRQTESPKLIHMLKGDLDWIVMKCLEKDRTRRYETASGLAIDIQRHLAHEPVIARAPSKWYVFQKFVRRNRLLFSCIALVGTLLVLGVTVSTWLAIRASRAEREKTRLFEQAQSSGRLLKQAHETALNQLRASYLAEARALRSSGRAGQRFSSLEAVKKAAGLRVGMDVRNAAIACLAVPDLRVLQRVTNSPGLPDLNAYFDPSLERYALLEPPERIVIRATADNRDLTVLRAPGAWVVRLPGFSPDGRFLAAVYWKDGRWSLWVWDIAKAEPVLKDLPGDNGAAFSPDNHLFASGIPGGTIVFFETETGRETRRLLTGRGFNQLAFSPDGARMACGLSGASTVDVLDLASGDLFQKLRAPRGIGCFVWSRDGTRLAAGCGQRACVWHIADGRIEATLDGHAMGITSLAFDPTRNIVATSSWDNTIRLWNFAAARQIVSHPGNSAQLQFSPDGRRLAPFCEISQFGLLEVGRSECYRTISGAVLADERSGPTFSPDGRLVAAQVGQLVLFWDTSTGREVGSFLPVGVCDSPCFNPRRELFISSERSGGLFVRAIRKSRYGDGTIYHLSKPRRLYEGDDLRNAAVSADGRYIAFVSNHTRGEAVVLDLDDPTAKVALSPHPEADFVAISPEGRWVATGSVQNSLVRVWEVATGQLARELKLPTRAKVAFSPDGRWLATCSTKYQLWQTGTWSQRQPAIEGDPARDFNSITFSPDGRLIAIVRERSKVELRDTLMGTPLATLESPDWSPIFSLAFSPDGTRLAALGWDQQIQLWDLRRLRQELRAMNLDWDAPPFPTFAEDPPSGSIRLDAQASPFPEEQLTNNIPPRSALAKANLIDLGAFYNVPLTASWHFGFGPSDLSELPTGVQTFAGVEFDVRGLIQVGTVSRSGFSYPLAVNDVPMNRVCERVHFLHSAIFAGDVPSGTRVGSYVIHYDNGRQIEVPIVVGQSVADWFSNPNRNESLLTVAWEGQNAESRRQGRSIRLFKSDWENPFPREAVKSFDLVSNPVGPAPFLVAVTTE